MLNVVRTMGSGATWVTRTASDKNEVLPVENSYEHVVDKSELSRRVPSHVRVWK